MQHATYITREHIGTPGTLDKIKFFYNIYVVLTVCTHRYPASTTIFKFLEILSFSQYNNRFSLVVVTVHRQFTLLQRYSTGYMCIFFKNYKVVIKIYLYDGVVVRVVPVF